MPYCVKSTGTRVSGSTRTIWYSPSVFWPQDTVGTLLRQDPMVSRQSFANGIAGVPQANCPACAGQLATRLTRQSVATGYSEELELELELDELELGSAVVTSTVTVPANSSVRSDANSLRLP